MRPETLSATRQQPLPPLYSQWEHLEAEFARLDILLRREVCRWELAGQESQDEYRGMYLSPGEANRLLERPLATSWGQTVALPDDLAAAFAQSLDAATQHALHLRAALEAQNVRPYMQHIAEMFGLDEFAQEILLLALAPALDSRYEQIFGFLQDNVRLKRPSIRLALNLFGTAGLARYALARHFDANAPLIKHGLIELIVETAPANEHWIHQTLHISDTVAAWFMGYYRPLARLHDHVQLVTAPRETVLHEFAEERAARLHHLVENTTPQEVPLVAMYGVDLVCQHATAALLAAHANRPLLTVALDKVVSDEFTPRQAMRQLLRDALLTNAVLLVTGWQICLDGDLAVDPPMLREVCDHPGIVVLSSSVRWQARAVVRTRSIWWEEFALPTSTERSHRWQLFLQQCHTGAPYSQEAIDAANHATTNGYKANGNTAKKNTANRNGHAAGDTLSEHELSQLTGRFMLTTDQIRDAVMLARDRARHEQRDLTVEDLYSAARACSNPRLAALAHKVSSRYAWDELILPPDQLEILQELITTIQNRSKVLEEWGVGRKLVPHRGVTALFTGPSGTGKTMAAALAANTLELDLYKIDLSSLVSKYIGETEKNLERIFTEATTSNAVLFFDEADAIFGKRSEVKDAHDRYANIEVSYLLQRIEAFDGVIILATNLPANIDEAFARRLQFSLDFPFPQSADRLRIWQTLFPDEVPRADDLNLELMAERFELTGGNIRNIIVSAAYLAAKDGGRVTTKHLLHGTRRELQKIGRLVGDADFALT